MSETQPSVLIIDDDTDFAHAAAGFARERGFEASVVHTLQESRRAMERRSDDLTMLDVSLPDGSAFELIDELDGAARGRVALVTGHNT